MIIAAFIWIYLAGAAVSWFFCKEVVSPKPDWQDYAVIATWFVSIPALVAWVIGEETVAKLRR